MVLYSFAVRKKGTEEYVSLEQKNELVFLDKFATSFNSKESFMRFLGINLEEFDDIKIIGSDNELLPVYFDAPDIFNLTREMIKTPIAFTMPSCYDSLTVSYFENEPVEFNDISLMKRAILTLEEWYAKNPGMPLVMEHLKRSLKSLLLRIKRKTYGEYANHCRLETRDVKRIGEMQLMRSVNPEDYNNFYNQLVDKYAEIRKMYVILRTENILEGKELNNEEPDKTAQELYANYQITQERCKKYNAISRICDGLEKNRSMRGIFIEMALGSEVALATYDKMADELKAYYKPSTDLIFELRGNAKKLGTID